MFSYHYIFIDLKRPSENSRFRLDTSSLVIPNFDTKVTEYLCSGWVLFSSEKFRLFDWPFMTEFFLFEKYCCPELKFEKIFHL